MSEIPRVPHVKEDEWGNQQSYRVINALSVIAGLLALLSSSALLLEIFWIFPVLGMVVSLAALRSIARQPHIYSGKKLAILSLVACLLLGGWSVSRYFFIRSQLYAVAEEKVLHWFELVRAKKLEEAHQLALPIGMRAKGRTTLRQYYANEQMARNEMNGFFSEEPLSEIAVLPDGWTVTLAGNQRIQFDNDDQLLVFQHYEIRYQQEGESRVIPVEVKSSRMYDKFTRASHWTLVTILLLE